jgi:HSP20 family protein
MQTAKELQPLHSMIVEVVVLFNRMEEIQQAIASRAYELFEERGRAHGRDFDDWAAAESELLAAVSIVGNETAEGLEITAEIPGFNEKEIEIAVEPRRVFLSGKAEKTIAPQSEGALPAGRQMAMFFRAIDLPTEVDATKAEAHLQAGQLRLSLPKLKATEKIDTKTAKEIPVE